MNIQEAVTSVLTKYATFSGRASRSEYWWFALANVIVQLLASVVDSAILHSETPALAGLLSLALLIPGLAVSVRRLHDIGKSGWNLLWIFLPLIGFILLLVWNCKRGDAGDNDYGSDPLADIAG